MSFAETIGVSLGARIIESFMICYKENYYEIMSGTS